MNIGQHGRDIARTFEGCYLKAYKCPAGVWTIGFGHTTAAGDPSVGPGMKITQAEANAIFARDMDRFDNQVDAALTGAKVNVIEQYEFDAMVSFAFNVGIGGFKGSSVYKRYMRGDKAGAAAALLMWNKAKVNGKRVVLKGLDRRRRAEKALMEGRIEEAYRIAGAKHGDDVGDPMDLTERQPQKVEPPKTKKTDKSLVTTITTATVGTGAAYQAGKQAVDTAKDVKDTAGQVGELLGLSGGTWLVMIAGVALAAVVGFSVYMWWKGRHEEGETEV